MADGGRDFRGETGAQNEIGPAQGEFKGEVQRSLRRTRESRAKGQKPRAKDGRDRGKEKSGDRVKDIGARAFVLLGGSSLSPVA